MNPVNSKTLRCTVFNQAKKFYDKSNKKSLRISRNLKRYNDVMILQTNKSNRIAILNKCEYIMKMENCISNMKCVTIYKDPISAFNNNVKDLIKVGSWPPDIKNVQQLLEFLVY